MCFLVCTWLFFFPFLSFFFFFIQVSRLVNACLSWAEAFIFNTRVKLHSSCLQPVKVKLPFWFPLPALRAHAGLRVTPLPHPPARGMLGAAYCGEDCRPTPPPTPSLWSMKAYVHVTGCALKAAGREWDVCLSQLKVWWAGSAALLSERGCPQNGLLLWGFVLRQTVLRRVQKMPPFLPSLPVAASLLLSEPLAAWASTIWSPNQIRSVRCFNYFLLVWSGGYLVWWAVLQALSFINTTLYASCASTGVVKLSTCVASSWYDTVASIYNYKRKLLYVDYPVFFSSDGNYLHKFRPNPRNEVLLKIYT